MPIILSAQGKEILAFLVGEIHKGRFNPNDERTFCGYKEAHDCLGLSRNGPHWGNSLRNQGLADLAEWLRSNRLPALTGLIVDQDDYRPGSGYYEVNGENNGDLTWWRDQIRQAIETDWSPWVNDYEPVTERELSSFSQSIIDGKQHEVTATVRERCEKLRRRARAYYRDPDGFLRCRACGWHKPDPRISGDIVELHHITPVSNTPETGTCLPLAEAIKILVPLCPTCHRILHARLGGGIFTLEMLKEVLKGPIR